MDLEKRKNLERNTNIFSFDPDQERKKCSEMKEMLGNPWLKWDIYLVCEATT
jgi:hypothetical protein